MKTDVVLIRYAEVGLKGKNRNIFENRLVDNIRACLRAHDISVSKITRTRGRMFVHTEDTCGCLSEVFGISTFSPALTVPVDIEKIKPFVDDFISDWDGESFRASCHRGDKTLPFGSNEVEREIGAYVVEKKGLSVDLKNYSKEISVEFFEGEGYLFNERVHGPGGLPLGASGIALLLVEDERALAAGWLMMKRGVALVCADLGGIDTTRLAAVHHGKEMKVVPATLDHIDDVASKMHVFAAVSSQDVDSLNRYPFELIVLRPLVGYDGDEIEGILSRLLC